MKTTIVDLGKARERRKRQQLDSGAVYPELSTEFSTNTQSALFESVRVEVLKDRLHRVFIGP